MIVSEVTHHFNVDGTGVQMCFEQNLMQIFAFFPIIQVDTFTQNIHLHTCKKVSRHNNQYRVGHTVRENIITREQL